MNRLTCGEREILAECEADAREAERASAAEAPDDGDEHELSAGDWGDVGHVDGYDGRRYWPPQDADLARHYARGYSAGRHDRDADDAAPPSSPAPGESDEYPF